MNTLAGKQLFAKRAVRNVLSIMTPALRSALPEGSFGEREHALLVLLEEAARSVLAAELNDISASLGEQLLIDGVAYRRHQGGVGHYASLNGSLEVTRSTYRQVGVRNGRTVVPLDLVAGLFEGATPAMAYNVADGYARCDMRQHGAALALALRVPPPRATLERLAKRIAKRVHEAVPRVEPIVRRKETLPDGACGVVMGLDRTSAPMAEPRAPGASPEPRHPRKTPRVRAVPPPIEVNFRMAYVGTVSFVDEGGKALLTRRYGAPACDCPSALAKRMAADVEAALTRDPTLAVGCVQDGAPEMWSVTGSALGALQRQGVFPVCHEAVDRFHVLERLGECLVVIEPNVGRRAARLNAWNDRLNEDNEAIDEIEETLMIAYGRLPTSRQSELDEHLVYLHNNKHRMRYVALIEAGLPVGSGVTESAAKTVINQRAKGSGQRWSKDGLRGVLTLRALHQSARLSAFWMEYARARRVSVRQAA